MNDRSARAKGFRSGGMRRRKHAAPSVDDAAEKKIAALQLPATFAKTFHTTYRQIAEALLTQLRSFSRLHQTS